MKRLTNIVLVLLVAIAAFHAVDAYAAKPVNFVVQLTRSSADHGQRIAFLQMRKILHTFGPDRVHFTVVAYEKGITALLADNKETHQLLISLADEGVKFEACRISMKAYGYKEADFPLEVHFVPAGAPEMIRLQMKGYKYWRP